MLFWHNIYYYLLSLPIKFLVRIRSIPSNPIKKLNLDITNSFLYVLPYNSKIDLFILRKQCYSIGLPDPLDFIKINNIKLPSFIFIYKNKDIFNYSADLHKDSLKIFTTYLDLHYNNSKLNIQILPIFIIFNQISNKKKYSLTSKLYLFDSIIKFFNIICLGRNNFIHFSSVVSLRKIVDNYGFNKDIINKLSRLAKIHYYKQRLSIIESKINIRYDLVNKLLNSKVIQKVIEDESKVKKISLKKAKNNAIIIIKEIAANFSYKTLRIADIVLNWAWNYLYQGINVTNIKFIHRLVQNGHKIVYIPSHRSHMDYLLLSYILYNNGLVPPHIAAGINLNFWPIGQIFRRLGAFFIRRAFKGNKLYSAIFYEYLNELFVRGYSIEYFIEGGRSRTGKLLDPKTGTLLMTIKAMLRSNSNLITIVPIYICYEHVLEITTYAKELKGKTKEKENFFSILKSLTKLRKLGYSYVNFGQPIKLDQYLNKYAPEWRLSINSIELQRPIWLNSIVTKLAHKIMVTINNAAAINAINLCSTILLSSNNYALTKDQLIEQIECYIQLLNNIPYSNNITIPNKTSKQLLENALKLNEFKIKHDNIGDIIILTNKNIILMTYYRNNIIHLLALPSLVANIILYNKNIQLKEINNQVILMYPFLKSELFIKYNIEELPNYINTLLNELNRQKLIFLSIEGFITINQNRIYNLQLLANNIKDILYRYIIIFSLLNITHKIKTKILEKESHIIAKRLSILHNINIPELFDKSIFFKLLNSLKKEGYINKKEDIIIIINIKQLHFIVSKLISPIIYLTIKNAKIHY
ncbi:MAG: glycerol-3-phosphate 1-O-acyltransferase PlsB [Arsenophonus endosymbiont of Ceratovacuna japonica]